VASALAAFLHHLFAFALVSAVVAEFLIVRTEVTVASARLLLKVDMAYGISALCLLIVGFARVLYFEKGAAYYFHNEAFHAKLGLFLLVGLVSIYPTVKFMSWRGALRQGRLPEIDEATIGKLRRVLHLEVAALPFILLCAALMARGIG
jgi:putative membrane protein